MTTTTPLEWNAAMSTYLGRRALLDLDQEIGAMAKARRRRELNPRDEQANRDHSLAAQEHRAQFQDPLVDAVVALLAVPAPDLDAVAEKRKAAGRSAKTHPDRLTGAFDIIAADIERLTGVSSRQGDRPASRT